MPPRSFSGALDVLLQLTHVNSREVARLINLVTASQVLNFTMIAFTYIRFYNVREQLYLCYDRQANRHPLGRR